MIFHKLNHNNIYKSNRYLIKIISTTKNLFYGGNILKLFNKILGLFLCGAIAVSQTSFSALAVTPDISQSTSGISADLNNAGRFRTSVVWEHKISDTAATGYTKAIYQVTAKYDSESLIDCSDDTIVTPSSQYIQSIECFAELPNGTLVRPNIIGFQPAQHTRATLEFEYNANYTLNVTCSNGKVVSLLLEVNSVRTPDHSNDTTPPNITVNIPSASNHSPGDPVTVNIATDELCTIKVGGTTYPNCTGVNFPVTSDGTYEIEATDLNNNVSKKSFTIDFINGAPTTTASAEPTTTTTSTTSTTSTTTTTTSTTTSTSTTSTTTTLPITTTVTTTSDPRFSASISVNTPPDKTEYLVGEELDLTGLTVDVTHKSSDGSENLVYSGDPVSLHPERYSVPAPNNSIPGTQWVEVRYRIYNDDAEEWVSATTFFQVNFITPAITTTAPPETTAVTTTTVITTESKKLSFTPNPKFVEFLENTNREATVQQTDKGIRIVVYNYSGDPTGHPIPPLKMTVPSGWQITYSIEAIDPSPQTVGEGIVNGNGYFIYYVLVEKTGDVAYTENEILDWYLSMDIGSEPITTTATTTTSTTTTATTTSTTAPPVLTTTVTQQPDKNEITPVSQDDAVVGKTVELQYSGNAKFSWMQLSDWSMARLNGGTNITFLKEGELTVTMHFDDGSTAETKILINNADPISTTTTVTTTTTSTPAVTTTTTPQPPVSFTKGDINNDGAVNADDASLALKKYARQQSGRPSEFTEIQTKAADVNEDGAVNSDDASIILKYYAASSTGNDADWDRFIKH